MRVPVTDSAGRQLMPCAQPKARHLLNSKQAKPKRNKLGIFYIKLVYEVPEPANQKLVVGIDPGSSFEGYSVVGEKETVLNIMAEAPTHVKKAVETRRTMRRARRHRKCWRRPIRSNRLCHQLRIPPSTRSRWEAKFRIVAQLAKILPLTHAVVEDVQAETHKGKGGQWNKQFSPVQVGKEHLYHLLERLGLNLKLRQGYETAELRQEYGLGKCRQKDKRSFESHCVDAWALAASITGAVAPTCKRIWYITEARLHRRQLHRLQADKGGIRKPYGGTMSLGFKRGALVQHPKHKLCSVGGFDRAKQAVSLHDYKTNKRLTQSAKVKDTSILTTSLYRIAWI